MRGNGFGRFCGSQTQAGSWNSLPALISPPNDVGQCDSPRGIADAIMRGVLCTGVSTMAKSVTLTAAEAAALLTLLNRVINAWHPQRSNYGEIFAILDKLGS